MQWDAAYVDIPFEINGYPVTKIGEFAFSYNSNLINVYLPEGITAIEMGAFEGCDNLTLNYLPDSIKSIGVQAFHDCINVNIEYLPYSLTTIEDLAFCNTGITDITIYENFTSIGTQAFSSSNLINITVDENNMHFSSFNGVLFNKDKTKLIQFPAGRTGEYTIPDGVDSIGERAFYNCSKLISVTISDSVTFIFPNAFSCCIRLTDVYYGGTEEQWGKIYLFYGNDCLSDEAIHFNSGGNPAISAGEISLVDGISFDVTLEADSYPGNIIAALYSGEDALKSVKSYPAEESVRVSFDKGQTGAYVKIMWWEDLSSMKPVCNSQIIPLQ